MLSATLNRGPSFTDHGMLDDCFLPGGVSCTPTGPPADSAAYPPLFLPTLRPLYACFLPVVRSKPLSIPGSREENPPARKEIFPFYIFLFNQFSSVTQLCPTLCDPMNCSTPGLHVHHQLSEFTQTHAIQPSHPLSSPFPPAPNPFQHQSLFQ